MRLVDKNEGRPPSCCCFYRPGQSIEWKGGVEAGVSIPASHAQAEGTRTVVGMGLQQGSTLGVSPEDMLAKYEKRAQVCSLLHSCNSKGLVTTLVAMNRKLVE